MEAPKFIADHNVGKLARWLRLIGYDAEFFKGNESELVARALDEDRIILTRGTRIALRRMTKSGGIQVVTFVTDEPEEQACQLIDKLNLKIHYANFTLCLECNQAFEERQKEQLKGRLPPYVYKNMDRFTECPSCRRLYWKGTHWRAMVEQIEKLKQC